VTRYLLPFGVFLVLVVFLALGLKLNPREVPSPLIGKPAPAFTLPQLFDPQKTFSPQNVKGQVWLLNVWASWCVSCRDEHDLLVELAKTKVVPIYGLNYKDRREDALSWLKKLGNPYTLSLSDTKGTVAIDYGVYGVPETYVIDKNGIIRYKQIGPLSGELLAARLFPLIKELQR
jgi:cytochrome c biogenesis protein CcmG/thiol:disulfide interchange protein DsbE